MNNLGWPFYFGFDEETFSFHSPPQMIREFAGHYGERYGFTQRVGFDEGIVSFASGPDQDAFRHAFVHGLRALENFTKVVDPEVPRFLTEEEGHRHFDEAARKALWWGFANEFFAGNEAGSHLMDLWNNGLGTDLARQLLKKNDWHHADLTNDDFADFVAERVKREGAMFIKNKDDPRATDPALFNQDYLPDDSWFSGDVDVWRRLISYFRRPWRRVPPLLDTLAEKFPEKYGGWRERASEADRMFEEFPFEALSINAFDPMADRVLKAITSGVPSDEIAEHLRTGGDLDEDGGFKRKGHPYAGETEHTESEAGEESNESSLTFDAKNRNFARKTSYDTYKRLGSTPEEEAQGLDEYRSLLRESYVEMNGHQEAAKMLAARKFARIWGLTDFAPVGAGTVVRYPVETAYADLEKNGHAYVRQDVEALFESEGIVPAKWYLSPNEKTARDRRLGPTDSEGYGPRMTLAYDDATGVRHTMTTDFQANVGRVKQRQAKPQVEGRQERVRQPEHPMNEETGNESGTWPGEQIQVPGLKSEPRTSH